MALREEVAMAAIERLSLLGSAVPQSLNSLVEEVEVAILNYCNILQVPTELKFVWMNMVLDYYKWITQTSKANANNSGENSTPTYLSSIKEGDTSLNFAEADPNKEAHVQAKVLDRIVLNYEDALNRFRKVVW